VIWPDLTRIRGKQVQVRFGLVSHGWFLRVTCKDPDSWTALPPYSLVPSPFHHQPTSSSANPTLSGYLVPFPLRCTRLLCAYFFHHYFIISWHCLFPGFDYSVTLVCVHPATLFALTLAGSCSHLTILILACSYTRHTVFFIVPLVSDSFPSSFVVGGRYERLV